MLSLFFFKQKTAYEMHISVWSSDVCSSDLSTLFIGMVADRFIAAQKLLGILSLGAGGALFWVSTIQSSPSLFLFGCLLHFLFYASTIPLATAIAFNAIDEIGRA